MAIDDDLVYITSRMDPACWIFPLFVILLLCLSVDLPFFSHGPFCVFADEVPLFSILPFFSALPSFGLAFPI